MAGKKLSGPYTNTFIQQSIPVKQLVYTTECVLATLLCLTVICAGVGIACITYSYRVQPITLQYAPGPCPDSSSTPCTVPIQINSRLEGPVYVYYTLTKYFQNHRRYVTSRSDPMNRGAFGTETPGSDPSGMTTCTYFTGYNAPDGKSILYYPCGLVAMSIFNDTFTLQDSSGSLVPWTNQSINWKSSDVGSYLSKDTAWLLKNCYRLGALSGLDSDFNLTGFPQELRGFNGTKNTTTSRYHR